MKKRKRNTNFKPIIEQALTRMTNQQMDLTTRKILSMLVFVWLLAIAGIIMQFSSIDDVLKRYTDAERNAAFRANIRDARFSMREAVAAAALYELNRQEKFLSAFKTHCLITQESLKRLRADSEQNSSALKLVDRLDSLRVKTLDQKLIPVIEDISINEATQRDLQKAEQEIRPMVAEFDVGIAEMKQHVPQAPRSGFASSSNTLAIAADLLAVTVACLLLTIVFRNNVSRPLANLNKHADLLINSSGNSDEIKQTTTNSFEALETKISKLAALSNDRVSSDRNLIEHAVDVICLINAQFQFVSVNPASKSAWGYSPSELIDRSLSEFILVEDIQTTMSAVIDIERSIDKISFENRFRRKDGSVIHLLWSVHWSASDQGLFCVVHDISERKEAEQLRRELLAMISHDLRTPLSAIKALLELIEDSNGQLNEKTLGLVAQGRNETERLISLVNDLLDIEKMNAGKFSINLEQTSSKFIIKTATDAVRRLAEMRSISIEVPSEDFVIEADSGRIIQVVVNLLSNAIKYSPSDATIEVGAQITGDSLRVSVRDYGQGIVADKVERIFEKFEQAEKSIPMQHEGTGLGLAICKTIVEQHGGRIAVDTEPGKGSTFWFTVPTRQTK